MVGAAGPLRTLHGRRAASRGFTFIEIIVVMAILAVLMGIGIGLMQSIGQTTKMEQAKAILVETASACKTSSVGDTKAQMVVRQRRGGVGTQVTVEALVARPVLSANFETLDFVSQALPVRAHGDARIEKTGGYEGNALRMERGGWLEFLPQTSFAMTEGFDLDCMVRTEGGSGSMMLLNGEEAYQVILMRAGNAPGYGVQLRLNLAVRPDAAHTGDWVVFTSKDSPIRTDGVWRRLQVRFDGREASILVDGLERLAPATPAAGAAGKTAADAPARRIVLPESGVVGLSISSPTQPFTGWVDSFVLGGIFRSGAWTRDLPEGLKILSPTPPVRASYADGRLDVGHTDDVRIVFEDETHPEERPWELRLGRHGTIGSGNVDRPTSAPGGPR